MSFGIVASSYLSVVSSPYPWQNRSILTGISVDPNGTNSHTCTFTPAVNGNLLVAVVAGAVTSSTPASWSLLVSAINYTGLYVFTKVANSGESSFTTTHSGSDYAIRGIVYEFPAGTTVLDSNSQINVGGGAITGPSVTGLSGTYMTFAARAHGLTLPNGSGEVIWTTPATKEYEDFVGSNGNDGIGLSVAYQAGMTGSSFSGAYNVTWDNTAIGTGEAVAFALSS